MAEYSKALGDCVYRRRKQLGWTQAELAEKIGVTEQTIRKMEHYLANPQMNVLYCLIRTLQLDPADIFFPEIEKDEPAKRQLRNLVADATASELEDLLPVISATLRIIRKGDTSDG